MLTTSQLAWLIVAGLAICFACYLWGYNDAETARLKDDLKKLRAQDREDKQPEKGR